MKTQYTAILIAALLAASSSAFAGPSFNCTKASSNVEKMICADQTLSDADSVVADLYKEVLSTASNPTQVKQEQRQWLTKVRNACKTPDCLAKAYDSQYNKLQRDRLAGSGAVNPNGSTGH
ncbi:lysozyme inhibitor LprI family protein [Ralstonia solanacearum]|uniref:lysozyme inhibitor LprI family protein n=1 Tax=Ralstonia solanacearum TaxID=305 RepID=UPI0023650376|nr:lysozyme inhibitor LprI family protein [Ralstonia solanacearum]MDD7803744.1 lysozyme inhibitor LprI family protein [Ralstonia solanacearum]